MKTMMKKLLTAALLTLSLSAASALAEPLDAFKGLSAKPCTSAVPTGLSQISLARLAR